MTEALDHDVCDWWLQVRGHIDISHEGFHELVAEQVRANAMARLLAKADAR